MRHIIVADAHSHPELIKNALDHAGFEPGRDAFVYAGDIFDRGPDPDGCLELIEAYATEVLLGNHDVAVLLDFLVYPSDPENRRFRSLLIDRVLNSGPEKAWKLATCVEGVLITHAGVSARFQDAFLEGCESDLTLFARCLNEGFLAAVRRELETGEYDEDGILGPGGPTWFRPGPWSKVLPLAGARQVVGHTPPVPELEDLGFFMIDPCAFLGLEDHGRFRYAVIEDGHVKVIEGSLESSPSPNPDEVLAEVCCQ